MGIDQSCENAATVVIWVQDGWHRGRIAKSQFIVGGAPTVGSVFGQRIIIGVGDEAVSSDRSNTLTTYALGSCIAVVVYDAGRGVGGLLHFMLPEASLSPEKAKAQPAMFVDTGLPLLLDNFARIGGSPSRSKVLLAGGASVLTGKDIFRIGERNYHAVVSNLKLFGLKAHCVHVGGYSNRTVHLDLGTGKTTVKLPAETKEYDLA